MKTLKTTKLPPQEAPEGRTATIPVYRPRVDVLESPEALILEVDVPGVAEEDLSVELRDQNLLEIQGTIRQREPRESLFPLVQEVRRGDFKRVFRVGESIDPDGVRASHRLGVLTVTLPKRKALQPRRIAVEGGNAGSDS
jgi:HSP20 family protein